MQSLTVDGFDVGKEITGGLENLRTALQGIILNPRVGPIRLMDK